MKTIIFSSLTKVKDKSTDRFFIPDAQDNKISALGRNPSPDQRQSIARVLILNRIHNLESFSGDASIISGCCLVCVLFIIGPSRRLMSASVSRIM